MRALARVQSAATENVCAVVLEKRKQPVSVETPTYTASASARSALTPISSSTSHTTSAQEALSPSTSSCSVKEVAEL